MKQLVLLIALVFASGCDVIADINSEIGYSEAELSKGKPEAASAAAPAAAEETPAQRSATWWENAKTLAPAEKKQGGDAMVRCRVAGSERFTLARDCISSGGTVLQ